MVADRRASAGVSVEQALRLHGLGFSIIPVPSPIAGTPPNTPGDGKTPIVKWKHHQTEPATEAEITAWFSTPQNLAIVTGAISDLVVVDPDSRDGLKWCVQNLPYTPWQVRTSKGFHLYYRHPGVPVRNKARLDTGAGKIAIDIRGDGGYVIGPGSLHMSGHVYSEAGDWTRDDPPRFWPGWIAKAERPAPPVTRPRPTGDVIDRARRYLAAIPPPVIGAGSDHATLYAACRLVRGFEIGEADAVQLLEEWAGGRPGWDRQWLTQKVQHALRYGSEPVGALR